MKQMQGLITLLEKLANEVYKTLGDGFSEDMYQRALAFELRNKSIDYLRETNVEIFYKDQMIGLGEIDFYFPVQKNKYLSLSKPVILETKYLAKLNDSARSQLRQYLMSTKKNKTKAINKLEYGLLLNWQKEAEYDDTRTSPEEPIQIELWKYTENNNLFKRLYKSH
jgi:GxxExxY protein